jgi:Zn-dependent peptidase ImmA (M78 family)
MNSAQMRAQEIRRRYHFTRPSDIERVLKAENIQVVRFPLKGRVKEMIVFNFVGLPLSLERDSRERYELLAHALGHYLLHAGNQPFFHLDKDRVVARQWEHQAWDFAHELLMPADKLVRLLREAMNDTDLCEHFQVSEEFFRSRMQAFGEEWADRVECTHLILEEV